MMPEALYLGRVQRAHLREWNETRDPAQESRSAISFYPEKPPEWLLGPGSSLPRIKSGVPRPGHETETRPEANEEHVPTLNLPIAGGKLAPYTTKPPRHLPAAKPPFSRIAYAAAHVVADPLADCDPWLDAAIDWERTIAFRRHLWSLGLGVAEAMDTAQRGMGVDWPTSLELIRRSLAAAKDFPGALIGCGAGTDHLEPGADVTLDDVIRAYEEQCAAIEKLGGRIVLMASRALVKAARSGDDYAKVYGRILSQVKEPVIIHWLGEMFDPALEGYWGHRDHEAAMDRCRRRDRGPMPPRSTA